MIQLHLRGRDASFLDDWSLDEPERERWDELGELEQAGLRRTYDHGNDLREEQPRNR